MFYLFITNRTNVDILIMGKHRFLYPILIKQTEVSKLQVVAVPATTGITQFEGEEVFIGLGPCYFVIVGTII